MSSNIVDIPDQDVENRPSSEPLSGTNNNNGLSISNSPTVKRNNYMKQRGRRRKWWYFNRGLQPISEVAEIKDEAVKCENNDDSPNCVDDSNAINNYYSTEDTIIISNYPQNKEGYSACLKVIEKFQEVVIDSAVRVIQAAFKRFRERRRFLRIKKAVMVIQRNLRKWLESKHPCIRPANFERQSSDSSKSDEYRESIEYDFDGCVIEENGTIRNNQTPTTECEKYPENNDLNGNDNSLDISILVTPKLGKAQHIDETLSTQTVLDGKSVKTELKVNDKSEDMEPDLNTCLPGSEEETIESRSGQDEKPVMTSEELKQEKLDSDVKSLLEELLLKVTNSFPKSEVVIEEFQDFQNIETSIVTKDICSSLNLSENGVDNIEAQKDVPYKTNMDLKKNNLNYENKDHNKTLTDDLEETEKQVLVTVSPDSLKAICQNFVDLSGFQNLSNMEKAGS